MPDSVQSNHRLEELKRRFEADPGSRLYLQLADEYRRQGQHPEAITVLQAGLEQRPRDLTGLLALGRCYLEMGSEGRAAEILEGVVERDPTHIVANKLVLEAHLQGKSFEKAQQRLEIYRLLNDRDPELDHLQFRLDKLRNDPSEVPTEVLDQHSIFDFPAGQQDGQEDAASARADEQIFQVAAARSGAGAGRAEVFDFLPSPRVAKPRAVASTGGIFSFLGSRSAATAVSEASPSALEIEVVADETTEVAESAVVPDKGAESAPSTPAALLESVDSAASEALIETPKPRSDDRFAEVQGFLADEATNAAVAAETEGDLEAEPSPPESDSSEDLASSNSTVTLAELYLEQGHLSEAEEIFRQVLERDPDSAAARAGLRQIVARQAGELTASELLVESDEARPRGLTERKVTVLKRYLQRLRGARNVR